MELVQTCTRTWPWYASMSGVRLAVRVAHPSCSGTISIHVRIGHFLHLRGHITHHKFYIHVHVHLVCLSKLYSFCYTYIKIYVCCTEYRYTVLVVHAFIYIHTYVHVGPLLQCFTVCTCVHTCTCRSWLPYSSTIVVPSSPSSSESHWVWPVALL